LLLTLINYIEGNVSISISELESALSALRLVSHVPLLAHVDIHAFGPIQGGAQSFLEVLRSQVDTLVMPVFTYRTMVLPASGPENNGMHYSQSHNGYSHAEIFDPAMPADAEMGEVAELLRGQPGAARSSHPVLSFASIGVAAALRAQTLEDPFGPIRVLAELEGCVLLAGEDHTRNVSLHLGERMAGRKTFVRWALTSEHIVELHGMPGCSRGFNKVAPHLEGITREARLGDVALSVIPLRPMLRIVYELISSDPLALLCDDPHCLLCASVRSYLANE
jgi:aminoglycoside 3-N-acetyltransferase